MSLHMLPHRLLPVAALMLALMLSACAPKAARPAEEPVDPIADLLAETMRSLAKMGYSTQVGAFAQLDNAVRLERLLQTRGVDAYYFRHPSGLYKVRFGNHADYDGARDQALQLQRRGAIGDFFIVAPEDYPAARIGKSGSGDLRTELVRTARLFIGVPYLWGGTDKANGFDCSGLTMVCYRLSGLNLPRNSRKQYRAGHWVPKAKLRQGDLVFFATGGGKRVSHVGMYIGGDRFIHAPRTGKTVRIQKLSNPYFTRTYMGGRSYL